MRSRNSTRGTLICLLVLSNAVPELTSETCRFSIIPSFGRGTIRPFGPKTSKLTGLAARDFEQNLKACQHSMYTIACSLLPQCAMIPFEQMFRPEYDSIIQDMLWELAQFHGFGRGRIHWTTSLLMFDNSVITMGTAIRRFQMGVCPFIDTRELPRETDSRQHRKKASANDGQPVTITPKTRRLNLNTYKYHRLGDYPQAVREFGPLDVYSTQTVRFAMKPRTSADFRH